MMRGMWRGFLGRSLTAGCALCLSACNFADMEDGDAWELGEDMRDMRVVTSPDMGVPSLDMNRPGPDLSTPKDLGVEDMFVAQDMRPDMQQDLSEVDMPSQDMSRDLGGGPPVCGNSVVEVGELCDGNCPQTCSDGDMCTRDVRAGDDNQCNVVCSYPAITTCVSSDGCCPPGCTDMQDNDCPSSGIDCKNAATWPASWQSTANGTKTRVDQVRQSGMCNATSYPSRGALSRNAQLDQAARCVAIWFQQNPDADANALFSEFVRAIGESGYQGAGVDVQFIGGRSSTVTRAEDRIFGTAANCQDISDDKYRDVGVAYLDTMPATSNHFVAVVLGKK